MTATQITLHWPLMNRPAHGEFNRRQTYCALPFSPTGSHGHQVFTSKPQPQTCLHSGAAVMPIQVTLRASREVGVDDTIL